MASDLIGRTACPECGFQSAHVKIKTDKAGAHPYRHCPECGAQYFTRNKIQGDNLRAQIRAGSETQTPTQTQTAPGAPDPVPEVPPAPKKTKIVFGVRIPA